MSSVFCQKGEICRCFANFSSEQEHFTHGMLIRPLDVKIKPIVFYEGINAKVFRRSIAFAMAVVVKSCSISFEYTISVHATACMRGEKCV